MTQKEIRDQYIAYRFHVLQRLNITVEDFNRFRRFSDPIHKIYEKSCNGYFGDRAIYRDNKMINEFTDEMYEAEINPLYKKVEELAHNLHLFVYFQTDPRGGTIYLDTYKIDQSNYNTGCLIY